MKLLPQLSFIPIKGCNDTFSCFNNSLFLKYPIKFLSASGIDLGKKPNRSISARAGLIAMLLFIQIGSIAHGQTQVFLDNFNRPILTSGAPASYTLTVSAGDGGASINSSAYLDLTNDISTAANADGVVYISGATQNFSGNYSQTLHSNVSPIEWTFNFRYSRTSNPSGLAAGNYGTAIILAASNDVFAGSGAGNGYAIVYGSSGTQDPIRLVKFAGGIPGTITTIISSGINDISAVNNYVSVRVVYEPTGDNWSLFVRDDGSLGWIDPSIGVTNQKSVTTSDNTFTAIPLTHFGFYWAFASAAAQTSQFDNFGVSLTSSTTPTITVNNFQLPSFGTIAVGSVSGVQSFTISGINLTAEIVITSPSGFEIRTGANSFSSTPITLIQTNGIVGATIINTRFCPSNSSSYSGNITCSSTGAAIKNIAVSGAGASAGLEVFITSDPFSPDNEHSVFYPHAGIGTGTVYSPDDWTYNSPTVTFYAVPSGSQSLGASEFEINWDAAKASLSVTNGNMFDFFALQNISSGKLRIDAGASSSLNVSPGPGKYLAQLNFTVLQPGFNEITITGADFRYFDGDTQQNLQATTHSGLIKFYLGDFASPHNLTTSGDGKINFDDLVQFALAYFSESDGTPDGYKSKFDIGPTNSTGSYFTMPNPDGRIQFEDLAIFSIGYGKTAALQLPKEHARTVVFGTHALSKNADGLFVVPLTIAGSEQNVRALSLALTYPSTSLEYIGFEKVGEMNHEYCFMAAQAVSNTVTLDAAVIGTEHDGLSTEGVFAYVYFKQRAPSKNYDVIIQSAKVRDRYNHDLQTIICLNEIPVSDIPTAFVLSQNYPNPFNPSTVIEYQLPATETQFLVSLKVYDLLGHELMTLVNKQQAGGRYEVEWNGRNTWDQPVSSGMYFYQFRAVDLSALPHNDFVCVKKMVLMK